MGPTTNNQLQGRARADQVGVPVRGVRASTWLDTAAQDLRYAARTLAQRPGFTAVAVIALALGIGANTAVFSVANAVLFRPLAYADADRLVVILHRGSNPVAPANYLDWKHQSRSFARMGAAEYWQPNFTGGDVPERLWALRVSADVLPMLGVSPLLGRVFLEGADENETEREVVIGWSLWQRRFAADPTVLGRRMTLDGNTYTIVGVMPKGFRFAPFWATKAEAWAPLELAGRTASRGGSSLRVFARLAPGVDLSQARAEMAAITKRLEREYPGTNREVKLLSLKEKVVGDIRPALLVLLGAVTFVLLIACANVAHVLLARAASRQKEIALRTALGATRARLIRQFLTESLLLAFMGGALGLALAVAGVRLLVAMSPSRIPRLESIGVDASVLGFLLLVSMLTGIAFGIAPALQTSAPNVGETLKESGRGATQGVQRSRLRGLLVSSEFALALVLLVAAGLMIRSFAALQAIDPGFDPRGVMSMVVSVTGSKEADPRLRPLFFQQVLERVRAIPGVQSASAINHLPIAGDIWGWPFAVEGRPEPGPGESAVATYRVVMPNYFRTMRLPILRGRGIDDRDILTAPRVVVVNEWLARRYWPGEAAVGKRITFDDARADSTWITVVGVSKDAVRSDWRSEPEEEIYLPYLQTRQYLRGQSSAVSYLTLVARARCAIAEVCDPAALAPAMRAAVGEVDRNVTVAEVQTLADVVREATAEPRFYMLLLGTFALVALTLAALGIYGVMSYSVSRRTHEIGVRMALGARRGDVLTLVVGQSMRVASLGAAVGIVAAFAVTRLMSTLLYGVSSTDPATFLIASAVLSGVALLASFVPARRATHVDPVTALRAE